MSAYIDNMTDETWETYEAARDVGDPIPLTDKAEIPVFPVDALPEPIADMVYAVAEATQTDPAMAGTCAISTMSACAGGHAEIGFNPAGVNR